MAEMRALEHACLPALPFLLFTYLQAVLLLFPLPFSPHGLDIIGRGVFTPTVYKENHDLSK